MNRYLQVLIGALATGMVQFSLLVASGVTQTLPLVAGILGAVGGGVALHMKQLPQREWSEAERASKLGKEILP